MSSISHVLCCALKIPSLQVQSSPSLYVKNRTSSSHYTKLPTVMCAVKKLWFCRQSLHKNQAAHQARTYWYHGFCSMKQLRVFLLPMLVCHRVTPGIN